MKFYGGSNQHINNRFIFEIDGDNVNKYLVKYDKDKIKLLREEVIEKCSEIVYYEIDSVRRFGILECPTMYNYHCEKVGVHEYVDGPDEYIYHQTWNELKYPYLIMIIDDFISGNLGVLEEIYNPDFSKDNISFKERINICSKELDEIVNLDIYNKERKLEELKDLLKLAELNKNQVPANGYYDKLRELIQFEFVSSIGRNDLEKVGEFFGSIPYVTKDKNKKLILNI